MIIFNNLQIQKNSNSHLFNTPAFYLQLMIENPHSWPYCMQPLNPNPWSPSSKTQNNNKNSNEKEQGCCSQINDWKEICMGSEGIQVWSQEMQVESVESEAVQGSGRGMEEESLLSSNGHEKNKEGPEEKQKQKQTIGHLIEGISFQKKKQSRKPKPTPSETSSSKSLNNSSAAHKNQQSKCWTKQQQQLFSKMVAEFGTDFNLIKQYFPKKSKNQIKSKYKEMVNMKKKREKGGKSRKLGQGKVQGEVRDEEKGHGEKEEMVNQDQPQCQWKK